MISLSPPPDLHASNIQSDQELFVNPTKSKNQWIAGLSSFVIHLVILLAMAIWTIVAIGRGERIVLQCGPATDTDATVFETFEIQTSVENATESGFGPSEINTAILTSDLNVELESVLDFDDKPTKSATLSDSIRSAGVSGKSTAFLTSSLEGRLPQNRAATGARNGATQASEAAVEAALAYIARHQKNNGSWTLHFEDGPCQGECDHSGQEKDPHEIAATGLALLCFMGAGHTIKSGEYSEQVSRGVYFLIQKLKIQSMKGRWLTEVAGAEMYEHGIATLALCEALQMSDDDSLKESSQAAINQIVYAQHSDGGWDYHAKAPGDLSIVAWQVMALKSAVSAKLAVSGETIRGIDTFLQRASTGSPFLFRYRGNPPTASMTAIGTLMRLFRGFPKTDPAMWRAIDYLVEKGPDKTDTYYNYYATQALFHYGGKHWETWNNAMREYLINTQETGGHSAGSWWFPEDGHNETAGRLYVTTMTCLTLEVYYRYLPVYEPAHNDFRL